MVKKTFNRSCPDVDTAHCLLQNARVHTRTDTQKLNPAPAWCMAHSAHLLRLSSRPQLRHLFTAEVERGVPVSHVSCFSNAFLARLHTASVLMFLYWGYKLLCQNIITAFTRPSVQESYFISTVTCSSLNWRPALRPEVSSGLLSHLTG